MKLKDVVRGVEEKDSPKGKDCNCGAYSCSECSCLADWTDNDIYNSLANAEVEVDREKIAFELFVAMQGGQRELAEERWTAKHYQSLSKDNASCLAQAIATAIESGSIIKLKEEK